MPDISCENLNKIFDILLIYFKVDEMGHFRESIDDYPELSVVIQSGYVGNKVLGDRLPWVFWKLEGG